MKHTGKAGIVWVLLMLFAISPADAGDVRRIVLGAGYGPQWLGNADRQNNSVIDLDFFFKEYPLRALGRSALLLGVGYSYLWTDADVNHDNHVISLLPAYRYYFEDKSHYQLFIHIAAGPSVMSSKHLGYQEQGSTFIFNNYVGFGVRFGEGRAWEVSWAWRHLSNANLFKPNHGYDVPFTFSLGRVF